MVGAKRAVVIGVNEYKDARVPALTGAVNDAEEFRDRLRELGNFEIADNHFLTNTYANCTSIRKAMSDLFWKIDSSPLSFFYFSGHGFRDEYGNGYIAPYDIDSREPLVGGIRMREITEFLLAAKNKDAALVILDCCYSGVATEGKGGPALGEPASGSGSLVRGAAG